MMSTEAILLAFVIVAGFYMAWNIGANDVANAMGTSVGSGALLLKQAVVIAAVLEFSGALLFGSHVSATVQQKIVDPQIFSQSPLVFVYGMLASLVAAGAWLQVASYFGWPVSTTHSIVGSLIGFGAIIGGVGAVQWEQIGYIVSSWIVSPVLGGLLSFSVFTLLRRKVFYANNPLVAVKKVIPLLVFCLIATFSLLMLLDGKLGQGGRMGFLSSLGLAFVIASLASTICFLFIRRVPTKTASIRYVIPVLDPSGIIALRKAKKHLIRFVDSAVGNTKWRAMQILHDVTNLSQSIESKAKAKQTGSDFALVERMFAYLQILSTSFMAFAHGANDVANAIGPLSAAFQVLRQGGLPIASGVPTWALTLGGVGIIIGLATWGWRVIETVGRKITELTPTRGFSAEFGAATTILIASRLGMPISTTHTIVGAVIGVGLARGIEALNLVTIRDIVISWVVTVPAGAAIAVTFVYFLQHVFG